MHIATGARRLRSIVFAAVAVAAVALPASAAAAPAATLGPINEGAGAAFQHVVGSTVFFNPAMSGDFTVEVVDAAGATAVDHVDFPGFPSGWTPVALSTDSSAPFTVTYSWSPGAATPGPVAATAVDAGSATAGVNYDVQGDSAAPSGGAVSYVSVTNASTVTVGIAAVADPGSGVGTTQVQRASAPLAGGVCGGFGGFSNAGPVNPGSSYVDTVSDGTCYQYRLQMTDNVGNTTFSAVPHDVQVDTTPPTGTISAASPMSGSPNVTGTTADSGSGVAAGGVLVSYVGPSATSGTICTSPPLAAGSWSCSWNTTVLLDGTYTLTSAVTDVAGNVSSPPITTTVVLDNTAPTLTFGSLGSPFSAYKDPGLLKIWFKSNMSGTFMLNVNATDSGSGIAQVAFGPTPANLNGGGTTDTTGPNPYTNGYSWSGGTPPSAGTIPVTATDNAGVSSAVLNIAFAADTTAPGGGAVSVPGGFWDTTSMLIGSTTPTDTESGVATVSLQRASAPLSAGTCGAYGAFSTVAVGPPNPYLDAGLSDATCYRYQLIGTDNVGNSATFTNANEMKIDVTAPSGAISASPVDPFTGAVTVTGTASDSASGIGALALTYSGPASGTVCPLAPSTSWSCGWDPTSPALPDGTYTLTLTVTDAAGNDSTPPITRSVVVDNNPPVLSFASVTGASGAFKDPGSLKVWFNPTTSGSFTVNMTASDAGSGVANVAFGSPGAGWIVGTPLDTTGPSPYSSSFAWSGGSPPVDGTIPVTATDIAGMSSTAVNIAVASDTAAPTGSITFPTSRTVASVPVTIGAVADPSSGVASTQLQRADATLSNGSCGAFGGFSNVGSVNPTGTVSDTTVTDGNCYQYRLSMTDNVGNVATTAITGNVQVDTTAPTGVINAAVGAYSGTATVSGSVSDAGSGVTAGGVMVTYAGAVSGTVCSSPVLTAGTWTCPWDTTSPALPDGSYTLTLSVTDAAGNVSSPAITSSVQVDNAPPALSFASVSGTSSAFKDPGALKVWFNPGMSGSFTLNVNATDGGSGVASVAFGSPGAGWIVGTPLDTTGPNPYTSSFAWSGGSPPSGGTIIVTATDNAGLTDTLSVPVAVDVTTPASLTVTEPSGSTNSAPNVIWTTPTDADSGVDTVQVQRAAAPATGAACGAFGGFTNVGTPHETSPFVDLATTDGTCYRYQVVATDNVGNATTQGGAGQVLVDTTAPTGVINAAVGAYSGTATVSGSVSDAGSGVTAGGVTVTYAGAVNGTVCSSPVLTAGAWSCSWNTTSPALPDGSYTLTLTVTDAAGNVSSPAITSTVQVDNAPPVLSFGSVTGASSAFLDAGVLKIWFRSNMSGTFTLNVNATDAGSGMASVAFGSPGAGWIVGTATDTVAPFASSFAWSGGTPPVDGTIIVTATDNAGLTNTLNVPVASDVTGPAGLTVTEPSGATAAAPVVSWTAPTDAASGLASVQLQRASATLTGGTCGAFGAFTNLGAVNPTNPFTDTTTVDGTCYRYQVIATDNVGNATTAGGTGQVIFDTTLPTGTISGTPAGPSSGTVNLSGTAADSGSGVAGGSAGVSVTFTGPASGTVCAPVLSAGSWTCAWNTTTLVDGTYSLHLQVTDAAGNVAAGAATRTLVLDNQGPVLAVGGTTETTGGTFIHTTGGTTFFNPAGSGSFEIAATATDAGTGVQDVTFPALGSGWTGGGADTTSPYATTYAFAAGAASPDAVSLTAHDVAGATSTATVTVLADSAGPTTTISATPTAGGATLTFAATDTGSGVATQQLQRSSAPLTGGACGAFGAFANIGSTSDTSPFTDSSTADGTCYRYRLVASDNVGNQSTSAATASVLVDRTAPAATISATPASPFHGTVTLTGTAADTGAGMDGGSANVRLAAAGPVDVVLCADATAHTVWSCTWNTTTVPDGTYLLQVTPTDAFGTVGAATTRAVVVDNNGPSGGSLQYTDGVVTTAAVRVTVAAPVDGGTGVASVALQRSEAVVASDACGTFGAFTTVAATVASGVFTDTTVVSQRCYRYRLTAADVAGNQTTISSAETVRVVAATANDDKLVGGTTSDSIAGGDGKDQIDGGAGDDHIDGGAGDDALLGGLGADRMLGGTGDDKVGGGSGNDTLFGELGNDDLDGGTGNDAAEGGAGNDKVNGGIGNDTVSGGNGKDKLTGGKGVDRINGGAGDDEIFAKDGHVDIVRCGSGRDIVHADKRDVVGKDCERVRRS